jgi:hypothetical protein
MGSRFYVGLQSYRGLFFQPPGNLLRWLFSPETLNELPRPLWAVAVAPALSVFPTEPPLHGAARPIACYGRWSFDSIRPPSTA